MFFYILAARISACGFCSVNVFLPVYNNVLHEDLLLRVLHWFSRTDNFIEG